MTNTNIATIKTWPNDAVVESIQGRVTKSYEVRTVSTPTGQKTVQNAEFEDAQGGKIRLTAWEHPDMKPLEGREVVLHSSKSGNGKFGGVTVRHSSYVNKKTNQQVNSIELSVSKLGQFQTVEVYRQNSGVAAPTEPVKANTSPEPTQATNSEPEPVKTERKGIYGGTVGMAINQACAYLIASKQPLTEEAVHAIASGLVRVSQKMEAGELI